MNKITIRKPWLKALSGALVMGTVLGSATIGLSGCEDVRVRPDSYGSSYYRPYDYYYYPRSSVYLSISTGDYFYRDRDHWRRIKRLPSWFHLDRRDRVKLTIKSRDKPYLRYHEHRSRYGPRAGYDSYIRDYDYYYYPRSSIYFSISTGDYYYRDRDRWRRVKKLPPRFRLDQRDRVRIKTKSRDKPYLKHHEHRTRYGPGRTYRDNDRRDNVVRYNNRDRVKRNDDQGGFNRHIKPHDYYYYPSSNTYYSVSTGNYYYRPGDEWRKTKALPARYTLDSRDRVKVKVRSTNKPYIKNRVHKVEYKNRTKYGKDKNRDREERSHNKKWHWKSNKK